MEERITTLERRYNNLIGFSEVHSSSDDLETNVMYIHGKVKIKS